MWVAKGKYNNKIYFKEFESIYECQDFIDNNLINEMEEARVDMYRYLYEHGNHKGSSWPKHYDDLDKTSKLYVDLIIRLNTLNNPILCWNVEQSRFCDGFDF